MRPAGKGSETAIEQIHSGPVVRRGGLIASKTMGLPAPDPSGDWVLLAQHRRSAGLIQHAQQITLHVADAAAAMEL